jgi:homoserine kinase type II
MAAEPIIEVLDFESISEIVNNHYNLGELTSAVRIYNGYINVTNDIHILKDGQIRNYILRIYREGSQENKICFEHALTNELVRRGFVLSPHLAETKYQTTYVKAPKQSTDGRQELFVAIYQYLPGEDKYSWDNPLCTFTELSHAAEVLATYHNTIFEWRDITGWKEPGIIDQISHMPASWKAHTDSSGDSVFDRYLIQHIHRLNESVELFLNTIERRIYETLPHLIIHGDFHPGNLKFQDEMVVGLFDFDWSMLDARCFDVGLALTYFCTTWEEKSDGDLMLDRVSVFLDGYQACAQEMRPLGGLSAIELQYLPQMVLAGTLYVLHWAISEYYTILPDPDEYVRYLKHSVRSIKWFEHNWKNLDEIVARRMI